MVRFLFLPRRIKVLSAPLLALGLLAGTFGVSHAAFVTCRTDPTVYLSDGATIVMYADINTDIANVSGVTYELHVPVGVQATGMQYDQYGSLETVTIIDDQPANTYQDGTTVNTTNGVTFTTNASMSGTCTYPNTSVFGKANQTLWITFSC